MPGESSSGGEWSTLLELPKHTKDLTSRPDDVRLGQVIEFWRGDLGALRRDRPVLVGFPQDEGVRRNHGRPGAREAPEEIRRWLYRLTATDAQAEIDLIKNPPLDLGDVRVPGSLEESQRDLGRIIAAVLQAGAVPVVLGGGHETAYGHYLGYAECRQAVAIINCDAHLDVRPCIDGKGHSGSPFRQAMEHSTCPLPGGRYVCLGAQPYSVSQAHCTIARQHGCTIRWRDEMEPSVEIAFQTELARWAREDCHVYVSIDADVVQAADVPGVSAPNPLGLGGREVAQCARFAGTAPFVSSLDVVEINPRLDPDGRSARWAAVVIWNFLMGVAHRRISQAD